MKKRKIIIAVIAVLAFMNIVVFSFNIYKENKTYQAYLSDKMTSQASSLISSTASAERVISEVIESQAISKSQASSLYGSFNNIKTQSQNLIDLGVRLDKIQNNQIDKLVTTNSKIADYFRKVNDVMAIDDVDQVNPLQLEGFKEYQSLVRLYKEILKSNVLGVTENGVNGEFWHQYFANGVEKDDWINLIKGLEDVTPKYMDFTLMQ